MITSFSDIYQEIGSAITSDLYPSVTGDLLDIADSTKTKQRILRRLLTNPGDDIWHPNYGAGLQRYIGMPLSEDLLSEISALITSQILLENTVSQNPAPTITLNAYGTFLSCAITYYDAVQQQIQSLSFNLSN